MSGPIVIKNVPEGSNLDVNELQAYIKTHPSVLDKKNAIQSHSQSSRQSLHRSCKKSSIDSDEEDEDYDGNESDESDDSNESDKSNKYVSKRSIEIEKLEDQIKYLKLDLNNEQVKNSELTETLANETSERKKMEHTIEFIKLCIVFMKFEQFVFNFNLYNITSYNSTIIQSAKKFIEIETVYKSIMGLKKNGNIVSEILDYQAPLVHDKWLELKKSYDMLSASLETFGKRMARIKFAFIILLALNVLAMFFKS